MSDVGGGGNGSRAQRDGIDARRRRDERGAGYLVWVDFLPPMRTARDLVHSEIGGGRGLELSHRGFGPAEDILLELAFGHERLVGSGCDDTWAGRCR